MAGPRRFNLVAVAINGIFGIVGAIKPVALAGSSISRTYGTAFFAEMYGLRAIAVAVGVTPVRSRPESSSSLTSALLIAGATQGGDVAIALKKRTPGVIGAAVASAIHIGSLVALRRVASGSLH